MRGQKRTRSRSNRHRDLTKGENWDKKEAHAICWVNAGIVGVGGTIRVLKSRNFGQPEGN